MRRNKLLVITLLFLFCFTNCVYAVSDDSSEIVGAVDPFASLKTYKGSFYESFTLPQYDDDHKEQEVIVNCDYSITYNQNTGAITHGEVTACNFRGLPGGAMLDDGCTRISVNPENIKCTGDASSCTFRFRMVVDAMYMDNIDGLNTRYKSYSYMCSKTVRPNLY